MTEITEKYKSLNKDLNAIIPKISKIVDYNELDALEFLALKRTRNYRIISSLKFICIAYILIYLLFIIFFPPEFNGLMDYVVFWISLMVPIGIYSVLWAHTVVYHNYSLPYYYRQRKMLKHYQKMLNLLFNNNWLKNSIGNSPEKAIDDLNNKIDNFSTIFKSVSFYIKSFSILTIVVSIVSRIIFDIIISQVQNTDFREQEFKIMIYIMVVFGVFISLYLFLTLESKQTYGEVRRALTKEQDKVNKNFKTILECVKKLFKESKGQFFK
ncbi:MAG: hypothetical protein ACFFHV_16860 [Promethearchaeota archaeon]